MDARTDQFTGLAVGWAVAFSALAAQAAPPPEQTVAQWADSAPRVIAAESGARITGDWNTSVAPYMRRPMEVSGVDHPAASVWLRWSAKSGKTQVFLNAAFHCIDTAPRSMMVVCATDQKQKDFEREIWSPNVRATEAIRLKVMATVNRSGEKSLTFHKRFRGGFLKIINGGSESQLQQSDIGLIIYEEPSSYPADVGGRGPPIRQARSRQDAWGDDAKELGGGTPKLVGDCPVTDEVERRTQEKPYLPCPHCGALQLLVWENMRREDGRPFFVCQSEPCGKPIGHEHKLWMLEQFDAGVGGWLACFEYRQADGSPDPALADRTPPPVILPADWPAWMERRGPDTGSDLDGRDPSFDALWQAYSPFTTWARIWEKFDEASQSGNPEDLVVFWQQVLARPFEAAYERPPTQSLYDNREIAGAIAELKRGVIPPWAWVIVLAVDVQGDRLEWAAWAIGRERRMARLEAAIIPIPPVDPRAWSELASVMRREYEGPHCKPLGFDRIGIDTGGHHTNQAYVFAAAHRAAGVMALKGKPNDREALPLTAGTRRKAKVGRRVVADVQLYLVGTHAVKKAIYFGLAQTLAGCETGEHLPGSVTLEPTATDVDFVQITSEILLPPDPAKRRKTEVWEVQKGQRNEQLDMAVYAWALGWSFVPDGMTDKDWERLIAARRRDPAEASNLPLERLWDGAPTPSGAPAPPPGGGAEPGPLPVRPSEPGSEPRRNPAPEHPLVAAARKAAAQGDKP